MGKAARRKREAPSVVRRSDRPRWAGAGGFDYAWALNEGYLTAGALLSRTATLSKAEALGRVLNFEADLASRKLGTLDAVLKAQGRAPDGRQRQMEPALPGRPFSEDAWERELDEAAERHGPYAKAICTLAEGHRDALCAAVPILFDPLSTPEIDGAAMNDLRLPFPAVTCDFLAQSGMSLPVMATRDDEWVGLVAATFVQQQDAIDVWPVVTTLHALSTDEDQKQRTLLFGKARFGAALPEPPGESLSLLDLDGASVWAVSGEDEGIWAKAWVVNPALAAASALRLLEAVNVSLETADLPRAERRRAQRSGADPALEVVIRTTASSRPAVVTGGVDWQHRWTVRGHWKHFRRGPVFEANPRKRVTESDGTEAVRVWCPPFVKGPEGKPLVLKSRRADHGLPAVVHTGANVEPFGPPIQREET